MVFTEPNPAHASASDVPCAPHQECGVHSWACQAACLPQHPDASGIVGCSLGGEGQAGLWMWGLREQHSVNSRNVYTLPRPFSSWIINRGLVQRQAAF